MLIIKNWHLTYGRQDEVFYISKGGYLYKIRETNDYFQNLKSYRLLFVNFYKEEKWIPFGEVGSLNSHFQ